MHALSIFFKLCDLNLKKMLVYRTSFWISFVLMAMWVAAYFTLIEVIFYHTPTLAGWNKGQVMIIMSCYYYIQNISDIFFKDVIEDFGDIVRRGELDHLLTKPTSSRLLAFFRGMRFDHLASLVATTAMLIYGLNQVEEPITFLNALAGVGLMGFSLILYFSILSLMSTVVFWVEKNDTFSVLIFNVSQVSRYPRQIFTGVVGTVLTYGLPLALLASVPAEAILGRSIGSIVMLLVVLTAIFYILSAVMWRVGLRRYTSAN